MSPALQDVNTLGGPCVAREARTTISGKFRIVTMKDQIWLGEELKTSYRRCLKASKIPQQSR
jgi:hypothetical protein